MGCRFLQDIFIKYTIITLLIGFFARIIVSGGVSLYSALSIHPYPSLPESEAEAAEAFLGSATHILSKKS